MIIKLNYGRSGLNVEMNERYDITIFRTKNMVAIEDPTAKLYMSLENPIAAPPLRDIAARGKNACLVVSDITRPVPNDILLPPIIDTLEQAGLSRRNIRLIIATGIHRAPTDDELLEILGDEIANTCEISCHDARDASAVARIGYSSRGTPIEINRHYLKSDIKIVTGLVEPHFMAGYSGGRKSVAVGLTSIEAIKHLHGTKFLEHPGARNCELIENPLHAELTEIATVAGVDFCVNTVINAQRHIGGIFSGDIVQAHEAACIFAERHCAIDAQVPYDIVVTSAAGYPLDTTYYQAVKGLVGALGILSEGGHIILAAECSNGLGSPEFQRMLNNLREIGDFGKFIAHLAEAKNFRLDQWEVEMLVKALRRGKILLFSDGISEQNWPLTHSTRVESVEAGLSQAVANSARNPRIAVIPEGPYVIPINKEMVT